MIVVGFSGLAGAGKSTAARHLVAQYGFVRRPFAALLKGMLRALLDAQGIPVDAVARMVDGDFKELPTPYLGGASPRCAMQTLGTEWDSALAPHLWVDLWAGSLAGLERVVADDVRFDNEVAAAGRPRRRDPPAGVSQAGRSACVGDWGGGGRGAGEP